MINLFSFFVCYNCNEEVTLYSKAHVEEAMRINRFLEEKCPGDIHFALLCDECLYKLVKDEEKAKNVVHTKNFGC